MSKVKLTKNSWVDLKEIASEETLERVKQKFVEAGVGKIDSRYARWDTISHYRGLGVIHGVICFRNSYFMETEGKVSVKELLEEDEEASSFGKQLFGYKMRVTPEISELVQKAVFEAGGSWSGGQQSIRYVHEDYLFISNIGKITWATSAYRDVYKDNDLPELTLKVVKSLKIVSKEDPVQVKQQKELQEVIDNLKEQLHNAQQQLNGIKGE